MKIRKIASLCKARKTIALFEDDQSDEQWISDGRGIYPLRGMPRMDDGTVTGVLDVPEDKRAGYNITYTCLPVVYSFADVDEGEQPVTECGVGLLWQGQTLRCYKTSGGMYFLDEQLLSPLGDLPSYELYERRTEGGRLYFAVKTGFVLLAVLLPEDADGEKLLGELVTLENELETALHYREMEKETAGAS